MQNCLPVYKCFLAWLPAVDSDSPQTTRIDCLQIYSKRSYTHSCVICSYTFLSSLKKGLLLLRISLRVGTLLNDSICVCFFVQKGPGSIPGMSRFLDLRCKPLGKSLSLPDTLESGCQSEKAILN